MPSPFARAFAKAQGPLQQVRHRYGLVRRTLKIVFEAAAGWTVLWALLLVLQGIMPGAQVYLTKLLVDRLVDNLGAGDVWVGAQALLWPAILYALAEIIRRVSGSLNNWVNLAQSELVQDHLKGLIHRRAGSAPYHLFETATFYDHLVQASGQAPSSSLSLLQSIGGLIQSTVAFVSIAAILMAINVWLPLVLFVSMLPALVVLVKNSRIHHAWWDRTTTTRRWAEYFDQVLTMRLFAAEVRLYDLGEALGERYRALREKLRTERLAIVAHQTRGLLGVSLLALIVSGAAMLWMVYRVLRGLSTTGDLVAFYQAFSQGQGLMQSLLGGMNGIYADSLFLEHLFYFLDENEADAARPEPTQALPGPLQHGITFDAVTFYYPESAAEVLDRFSLHIPAGQIVAIVGANGAGKSTLTKLICRFFDPQAGAVRFDGIDIRELPLQHVRDRISIMFQHPIPYNATAAENIATGVDDPDPAAVQAAARAAGADEFLERLPRGYDTLLGRGFPGAEDLSGGQWQRLGLARAFYRGGEVFILDEPTSYMDSWTENAWMRRFRGLMRGKTAIVITHRFTTAMQADVIHVMMEGEIVESGSHEELLALGGHYATSWYEQTAKRPADADAPEA